jgi:hypothetical protein
MLAPVAAAWQRCQLRAGAGRMLGMQQRFDATLVVDDQGEARLEEHVDIPSGRHRVRVLVDAARPGEPMAWEAFIERSFGSLAESDFTRPPQGNFEQRNPIA